MRICGVDIASSGWSAIGLAVDGDPKRAVIWKPQKRASPPDRLDGAFEWFMRYFRIFKPDVVSVEQIAGFQNRKTIHSLARHEGIALLAGKRSRALVLNPGISQARGIVFGNGSLSKDDAWLQFRKLYPDLILLAKNSGGTDQMDALTHALAAPTVLERK